MCKLTSAFAIGFFSGLRSFTPIAVMSLTSPASKTKAVENIALVCTAAGELVADKHPNMPSRLGLLPIAARVFNGMNCSKMLVHTSNTGLLSVLAAVGAVAGAFAGHSARTKLPRVLKISKFHAALAEDAVCILGSVFVATMNRASSRR